MNQLLGKRTADMSVSEIMEATHLITLSKKLTLTVPEFAEVVGIDKSEVYKRLNNVLYPGDLLVGGYEARQKKKKVLFHTDRVIEYIKRPFVK